MTRPGIDVERTRESGPHPIDKHAWFYLEGDKLSVVVELKSPTQVSRLVEISWRRLMRLAAPKAIRHAARTRKGT